jgi:hypothetical protein
MSIASIAERRRRFAPSSTYLEEVGAGWVIHVGEMVAGGTATEGDACGTPAKAGNTLDERGEIVVRRRRRPSSSHRPDEEREREKRVRRSGSGWRRSAAAPVGSSSAMMAEQIMMVIDVGVDWAEGIDGFVGYGLGPFPNVRGDDQDDENVWRIVGWAE